MLHEVAGRPDAREAAASLPRRAVAEGVGTAFLLAVVVGSGIMAQRLCAGSVGLTLLANSLATGAGLVALILAFGAFSGAHFNPAVTVVDAVLHGLPWRDVASYVVAQTAGALAGVAVAEAMFGEPLYALSRKPRAGAAQIFAELVATFGLLAVVFLPRRASLVATAAAVGSYIAAAYWFTASTSFANPAVTVARSLTDTFTGIRPADVSGFLLGQLLGTAAFVAFARWLVPREPTLSMGGERR